MQDLMEFSSVSSGGKSRTTDHMEDFLGPYESTPRKSKKTPDPEEDLIDLSSVSSEGGVKTPGPTEDTYDLYVGMTDRKDQPEHWVMMIVIPGDDYCTFYHANHEPLTWPRYQRYTEPMKRFDHCKVVRRDRICSIRESDMKKFRQVCWEIEPHHCQRYIIGVLNELEKDGLVPQGTGESYVPLSQLHVHEGPNHQYSEEEYVILVDELGRSGAYEEMLRVQGWANENGVVMWNSA
ncbi:hypothetical protein BJY00DRAFT_318123 [Aspergillus carlsbadensis]|nr:hypothetical protein BJY00DRAFT_318123 [Aspergillus carlsbadensis]